VSWNANTESDLAGYRVYYALPDDPGWTLDNGEYSFSGAFHMQDVGNVTTCAIPVTAGPYAVCVTAYDTSGNESGYSEVVSGYHQERAEPVVIQVNAPPSAPVTITIRIE